jgi:hypothetical protein
VITKTFSGTCFPVEEVVEVSTNGVEVEVEVAVGRGGRGHSLLGVVAEDRDRL